MSMTVKLPDGGDEEYSPIADINVTPLVDVMLVLLIIFMVTAPLLLSTLPIRVPKADLQEMGKPRDPLIVSLDGENRYYLDLGGGHTEEVPYDKLQARLTELAASQPDNLVYIRADKGVIFEKVRDILKQAAAAGFYRVSLISQAQQ